MKVVVVGNGAREHAIAAALKRSQSEPELHAFMSALNPGIRRIVKDYKVGDPNNPGQVLEYCMEKKVEMAVVGPEAPLAAGLVDVLEEAEILCVGPRKKPAQLETDKSFARSLMKAYKVKGTPEFGVFDDCEEACMFIDDFGGDVAIKPAGLTGGKGVKIMGEHLDAEGAKKYVKEIFDSSMGKIPKVVLEERLIGEEFTLQGFVDGRNVVGTPMVQDHKRAYEGDVGPNTGGMGSYSDAGYILPFLTEEDYDEGLDIMRQAVHAVYKETGEKYVGFLYGQFMATADGLKVIEFNARLGDPEAMNILTILESDFQDICDRITGEMIKDDLSFRKKATVCKYLVPEGYPDRPKDNVEVLIHEDEIMGKGGTPYYASVREEGGSIFTSKSRAIAIVGTADSITEAEQVAEGCMTYIQGDLFHRKDIGTRPLVFKRIEHMKKIRGE
ncbi:MAG: phosphoribosylamine--glycine ligase [Candidatus Altiarchaeota archaeon]